VWYFEERKHIFDDEDDDVLIDSEESALFVILNTCYAISIYIYQSIKFILTACYCYEDL